MCSLHNHLNNSPNTYMLMKLLESCSPKTQVPEIESETLDHPQTVNVEGNRAAPGHFQGVYFGRYMPWDINKIMLKTQVPDINI